ncbi:MAG: NYN domain-containing protein [Rhodobacteraceae bacterium]|nr:NYN domain-containing protein [Paracoccaceae bacterium]
MGEQWKAASPRETNSGSVLRLALLVDGETIGHEHADTVLSRVEALGRPIVRRVYTGKVQKPGWTSDPRFQTVFIAAQRGAAAADIALAIDAVDLAHGGAVEGFVLVSSEQDFSRLAHRLGADGFPVLGIGEARAPASFRAACSEFYTVDSPRRSPSGADAHSYATAGRAALAPLDAAIHALLPETGASISVAALGRALRGAGHMPAAHGLRGWSAHLARHPHLYGLSGRGPAMRVYRARGA